MATITRKAYDLAFERYWKIMMEIVPSEVPMYRTKYIRFEDYTGCIPLYHKGTKSHTVTEEAMRRIEIINGPYAKTLLRVYLIKLWGK